MVASTRPGSGSLDNYGTGPERAELDRQRATDALELIRIAQDRFAPRSTPTVRAMLYTREAWAYSKLGRPSAFRRACGKAFDEFGNSDPASDPYWINYFDSAELAGTIGWAVTGYRAPGLHVRRRGGRLDRSRCRRAAAGTVAQLGSRSAGDRRGPHDRR